MKIGNAVQMKTISNEIEPNKKQRKNWLENEMENSVNWKQ